MSYLKKLVSIVTLEQNKIKLLLFVNFFLVAADKVSWNMIRRFDYI